MKVKGYSRFLKNVFAIAATANLMFAIVPSSQVLAAEINNKVEINEVLEKSNESIMPFAEELEYHYATDQCAYGTASGH